MVRRPLYLPCLLLHHLHLLLHHSLKLFNMSLFNVSLQLGIPVQKSLHPHNHATTVMVLYYPPPFQAVVPQQMVCRQVKFVVWPLKMSINPVLVIGVHSLVPRYVVVLPFTSSMMTLSWVDNVLTLFTLLCCLHQGTSISSIDFASFGNPGGACGQPIFGPSVPLGNTIRSPSAPVLLRDE